MAGIVSVYRAIYIYRYIYIYIDIDMYIYICVYIGGLYRDSGEEQGNYHGRVWGLGICRISGLWGGLQSSRFKILGVFVSLEYHDKANCHYSPPLISGPPTSP